jgi:hypothetical protein
MASLERLTDFLNVVASAGTAAGADEWAALPGEPMKRFTVDVPVHRRIKTARARRGRETSSVLRDLLEREFPETSERVRLLK